MDRHEIAAEFERKFDAGEIGSCSTRELQIYLEAISDYSSVIVSDYPKRTAHIQILNTLISVKTLENVNKTIEHTEETITKLDEKNSFLTRVVVFLAALSFIATCAQIYFTVWPPSKASSIQSQDINLQKSELLSSQNLPSKEHASKFPIAKKKNINTPEPKSGKIETVEKESYHQPKSSK